MRWISLESDGQVQDRGVLAMGGEALIPTDGELWIELGTGNWLKISVSEWGNVELLSQGPDEEKP